MKSKAVSIIMRTVLLAAFALPAAADLHAHDGHAPETGQWYHADVTVTAEDVWGIEHCFESQSGQQIRYRIEASDVLVMNFHAHPERDGEYHTLYFMKENSVASHTGEATADEPGMYCFAFYMPTGETVSRDVSVHYRVDP